MPLGADLLLRLQRRLGIEGVSDEALDPTELYEDLSMSRDNLLVALALSCPVLVRETVVLQFSAGTTYIVPAATLDPLRCLGLFDVTNGEPLIPSADGHLNQDAGDYVWDNTRTLILGDYANPPGGVKGSFVLSKVPVTGATTAADIGVPAPVYNAIVYGAAVLALTVAEGADPGAAGALLKRELDQLERLFSEYDVNGGQALRGAFLEMYGQWMGDSLR